MAEKLQNLPNATVTPHYLIEYRDLIPKGVDIIAKRFLQLSHQDVSSIQQIQYLSSCRGQNFTEDYHKLFDQTFVDICKNSWGSRKLRPRRLNGIEIYAGRRGPQKDYAMLGPGSSVGN